MAIKFSDLKKIMKTLDTNISSNVNYLMCADGSKMPSFNESITVINGSAVANDTITIDFSTIIKNTAFLINLSNSTSSATIIMQNLDQAATLNKLFSYNIIIKNGSTTVSSITWKFGAKTTLSTNMSYPGGSIAKPPSTITANAVDIWTFLTYDSGATLVGSLSMKDIKI